MADKKPVTEIKWTQQTAQGGHEDESHATDVEKEAAAHGYTPTMVSGPNDNQGGN